MNSRLFNQMLKIAEAASPIPKMPKMPNPYAPKSISSTTGASTTLKPIPAKAPTLGHMAPNNFI